MTAGDIELTWDAETRVASIRFARETRAIGPQARALVATMTGWIGSDRKPFALLGDGAKLSGVDAEYRAVWARFFRDHREDSYVAFFNMNALVRVAAAMFAIGTRLRLRAFATEEEARSWLRENEIRA